MMHRVYDSRSNKNLLRETDEDPGYDDQCSLCGEYLQDFGEEDCLESDDGKHVWESFEDDS